MKTPKRILPLVEEGIIDEVIRPLMSGKEAAVYVVRCGDEIRCAKVYKESNKRSFRQAVQYQEGRKVRNSRRARAMEKGSKFGNDVLMSPEEAREDFALVILYVMRMLAAGLVHGDLSEFNVLVDPYGPVIIDLPQAVDAAANNHAQWMLTRDVENMRNYYGQYAPELLDTQYDKEMWAIYEQGELHADTELTGVFEDERNDADVDSVLLEIKAAFEEEKARQERMRDADED